MCFLPQKTSFDKFLEMCFADYMKVLAVISLIIAIGVAGYEGVVWLGKSSLAPVIIALAVAIIFQSAYALTRRE